VHVYACSEKNCQKHQYCDSQSMCDVRCVSRSVCSPSLPVCMSRTATSSSIHPSATQQSVETKNLAETKQKQHQTNDHDTRQHQQHTHSSKGGGRPARTHDRHITQQYNTQVGAPRRQARRQAGRQARGRFNLQERATMQPSIHPSISTRQTNDIHSFSRWTDRQID